MSSRLHCVAIRLLRTRQKVNREIKSGHDLARSNPSFPSIKKLFLDKEYFILYQSHVADFMIRRI
eukprot:scaffold12639_cov68-Cyclotella_meneghiniana.AAC.3